MNSYAATVSNAFNDILGRGIRFLPELVGAIILVIIGIIVAKIIQQMILRILQYTRFHQFSEKLGLKEIEDKAQHEIDISSFIANLAYWLVFIVFLDAAFAVIHVSAFNQAVNAVIAFIPNIIAALIILVLGFVGGSFLGDSISGIAYITHTGLRTILGSTVKWIVIVITVMAALQQLNIANSIINILFTGIVASVSIGLGLALGLAFGLGGKDAAANVIATISNSMKNIPRKSASMKQR